MSVERFKVLLESPLRLLFVIDDLDERLPVGMVEFQFCDVNAHDPALSETRPGSVNFSPTFSRDPDRSSPSGFLPSFTHANLGSLSEPSELVLNYEAGAGGSIRVQISTLDEHRRIEVDTSAEIKGRTRADAVPLVGDNIGEVVQWREGSVIQPVEGQRFFAHLSVERSKIYAYEVRPARR